MLLSSIFFSIIVSLLFLFFVPESYKKIIKLTSLLCSSFVLILSSLIFVLYKPNSTQYQFVTEFKFFDIKNLNIEFIFGLDGISLYFFFLTSFLLFLCIIYVWEEKNIKYYAILLLLLELLLLLTFSVMNLFLFYIFFEAILIPIYLIIGVWGSREKKIRASYLLFFYTLCGSLLFLISILYIYSLTGSFNIEILKFFKFTVTEQRLLWIPFFLSFASKIPVFPFHIWLPEAHVEAPTVGSVILAGLLLKLGVYGFIRYSICLLPLGCSYFTPLVYILCLIGVIFASFSAIKQTDFKRIVAYSSIAHMNLVVLGIFCGNCLGLEAAIFQSISHGFVSSALFFLIGIVYSRYHSRLIHYYGGVSQLMPIYSGFFLFFTMSNIALPGTSSFVGEFLLLVGIFQDSFFCAFIAAISVVLSGAYSLWLLNRIIFGNIKTEFLINFSDLSFREFFILFSLAISSLYIGILSTDFLDVIHASVINLYVVNELII
jgi:proton-translocating NADH-quinone oxidoreductase chain M